MRDIKFRGKRVDNSEWVYGDLNQYRKDDFRITEQHFKIWDISEGGYEVKPETVGQLLYSEDGNEYYEGDKVIMHTFAWDGSDGAEIEGVLAFDVFGIGVDTGDGNSYLLSDYIQEFTEQLEVVGNIHEVDNEKTME